MIKVEDNNGWSANAKIIDESIFNKKEITARQKVFERANEIISTFSPQGKFGICLQAADRIDINIYISAIFRVRNTKRKAIFYVSCDDEDIIKKLVKATTITHNQSKFCPIIPNYTGDEFTDEEKYIIDFFCLKEMKNIFTSPFNNYAFKVASVARIGTHIPHEEEVFVLPQATLLNL